MQTIQIKRKPVPTQLTAIPKTRDLNDDASVGSQQDNAAVLAEKTRDLTLDTDPQFPSSGATHTLVSSTPTLVSSPGQLSSTTDTLVSPASGSETPASSQSFWKNALNETVHFAGGLISHPFEATKHYSILRHSHGLVYYKGPATSVAITVFSDAPLPSDRSYWLQRKGFSGHVGMKTSVLLRTNWNWIDVTPSNEALPSDLPPNDERAWQRDIKKFRKKASGHKKLRKHTPRETCVLRIPAIAEDGYLRVVMCVGVGKKKVVCPSPVFRVASTSQDVGRVRGAGLKTMPLEAGLKIGSMIANSYAGSLLAPVTDRINNAIQPYQPGLVGQEVGSVAYSATGAQAKVDEAQQKYEVAREGAYEALAEENDEGIIDESALEAEGPPEVIGPDSGPLQPFPITLEGKVIQGSGRGQEEVGIPTANLTGVPGDLTLRLNGIYFGWACIIAKKGEELSFSPDWHEAIITVGPSLYASPRVIDKNVVTVHILHDFGNKKFFESRLKLMVMGFLRPMPKPDRSRPAAAIAEAINEDISAAVASLSRENWGPQRILDKVNMAKSERSLTDKYVDMRSSVQKRVDSIPLHWAGIRAPGSELRDRAHGNGGLFVRR